MFGSTRWSPFEEILNVQREVDRVFNQLWSDLPTRATAVSPSSFQVSSTDDVWRIELPLPGIDPQHVRLDVAGNTLSIQAEEPGEKKDAPSVVRFQQTLTVPQFLDLEKITASHRHGMLQLTVPLKESVKPRRIQIESANADQKQLTAV
jgi:HSP20 family protein